MRHAKELIEKSRTHQVLPGKRNEFVVLSEESGEEYTVFELADGRFAGTCPFHTYHPLSECSHTLAVRNWLAESEGRRIYAYSSEEEAKRAHQRLEGQNGGLWITSRKLPLLKKQTGLGQD